LHHHLGYVAGKLKKSGTKVIPVLDNVIPHEKKFYDIPFTKYFLKRCSGFLVMSDTVKNDLLSLKPEANYLEHEHPLYDHFGDIIEKEKAREKLKIPEGKKILLFFGFIREYKGLDILIESMKHHTR
jgi:glycosyltransferase involved in cell wall biosynthesis